MATVWVRARAELRHRWRATLLLMILVGLAGGVVLAAVAGARRTDSAMDRFLAYNRPLNVSLEAKGLDVGAVERLPEVADAEVGGYVLLVPSTASGKPDPRSFGSINTWIGLRGRFGVTSSRHLLVAGRLPEPGQPLQVAVDETLANRRRVGPGETLRMWAYAPQQLEQVGLGGKVVVPKGPALDFTVTGVVRQPLDVSPERVDQEVVYLGSEDLYLAPAFWSSYGRKVAIPGVGAEFRLHGGQRDFEPFRTAVRRLPGGREAVVAMGGDAEQAATKAETAMHLQAVALLLFAGLTAVGGLLVVGQAIARQVQIEAVERPTLIALGMTRLQLVAVALARAAIVGVGGALLAVALAVLASPLAPIGLARRAEVDPGWSVDLPLLVAGAVGITLAVLVRAGLTAWWLAPVGHGVGTSGPAAPRPSQTAERLARAGASPSAVTGVRLALEPGGQRGAAVPVRTAMVGVVVAVMAVTGSLAFTASLNRLVDSPRLQGWNWDALVGNPHERQDITSKDALLARNPLVRGYTVVGQTVAPLTIGDQDVPVLGVSPLKGTVLPAVLEGRAPHSADEITLGRSTLRRLGHEVGDIVTVRGTGGQRPMRVTGEVLLPNLTMGDGAIVTMEAMRALFPQASTANQFAVEYAPGADESAAIDSLRRDFGLTVAGAQPPYEVENLRRVWGLPVALAALLAVFGAGTLGHLLVTSVRLRRRDLAVLKTLGFVRGQVSATVAWQATALAAVALLVGVPLGIALGRWAWILVNQGLHSLAGPVTPALAVLAVAPATVLVANLVAALPARSAAATRPGVVLRSE
jgi:MacB-like periplasmic core domain/FtsX-like permease family